jgi:hypothetical protein
VSTPATEFFKRLLRSESNLNGVESKRMLNLTVKTFQIATDRNRSTNDVRTPLPRSFQELLTLRSAALDGASLNTCSAYLEMN